MSKIKINSIGKIISGDEYGSYLKIIADSNNTGGFLILTSGSKAFKNGHDNWVENVEMLEQYFTESNWIIQWEI